MPLGSMLGDLTADALGCLEPLLSLWDLSPAECGVKAVVSVSFLGGASSEMGNSVKETVLAVSRDIRTEVP